MEVFGLGDSYNARNLSNSSTSTERLGLPSINFLYEFEESFLQAVLIYQTIASNFPQDKNRNGIGVPLQSPHFLSDDNETDDESLTQYILRYKRYFDSFELDLHYARKFDTSYPMIAIDKPNAVSPDLEDLDIRPYYLPVKQSYLSLQGEMFETLLKFEYIDVNFDNYEVEFFLPPATLTEITQIDFQKITFGAEKTHDYAFNHSATFLIEYTSVLGVTGDEAKSLGAFQRDIMLGYRHSFNDFKSHEIQIAYIYDLQFYDESLINLQHSMRFNNYWTMESRLTLIETRKPDGDDLQASFYGLKPVRESDNILINIIRFF